MLKKSIAIVLVLVMMLQASSPFCYAAEEMEGSDELSRSELMEEISILEDPVYDDNNYSNNDFDIQGDSADQTRSSNEPSVSVVVVNTLTTNVGGTKHKYEVYVYSNAGDLVYINGTKYSSLVIKTSYGGSNIFSRSDDFYNYPMAPLNYSVRGSFYRSINNPLTSGYVETSGAFVYGYISGWFSVYNFNQPIGINSPAAVISDR